jgi:hypothetical protein
MVSARPAPDPAPGAGLSRPASATVAAPIALDELEADAQGHAAWANVVGAINKRKRMLGAFLEESRFVGVSAADLVLGMDDLHRAVVEEKENRAMLAEEAQRAFARALVVRCVPLAPGEVRKPPAMDDVKPMVDEAIAFFEGDPVLPRRVSERKSES